MFEIYQSKKTNEFHFRLKAANGQVILTGQSYKDKTSCENGVAYIQENGRVDSMYELQETPDGRKYFILRSGDGQIIGQSQMYRSESGLKNGVISVGNNVANARLRDLVA